MIDNFLTQFDKTYGNAFAEMIFLFDHVFYFNS